MSIITIQLGQCGNQVGREVFQAISTDLHAQGLCSKKENDAYQTASKECFFSEEKIGGMITWDFFLSFLSTSVRAITTFGAWSST